MEQSKQYDDQVLALGKKIVSELELTSSNDTLGKWMSHYVAELIHDIEACQSIEEKIIKKKECFEVILKLWSHRNEFDFIESPVDNLKPIIEVLDVLKNRKGFHWSDNWPQYDLGKKDSWGGFIKSTKQRFETIVELVLIVASNKSTLENKVKWESEYESLLSDDDKALLQRIGFLLSKGKDFWDQVDDQQSEGIEVNYEKIVEEVKLKITKELDSIKSNLDNLDAE